MGLTDEGRHPLDVLADAFSREDLRLAEPSSGLRRRPSRRLVMLPLALALSSAPYLVLGVALIQPLLSRAGCVALIAAVLIGIGLRHAYRRPA
jgi:hypothetical protein